MPRARYNRRRGRPHHILAALIVCAALIASSCSSDRITFRFVDAAARAETTAIDVYAVRLATRSGAAIDCQSLLEQRRAIDDSDLVVAQQTTVPMPAPARQTPLLSQLPQADYAFYAAARDGFGFTVARGCEQASVSGGRPLDVTVALATVPAPGGSLAAVAATQWLQMTGLGGAEVAPLLAVRARDLDGQLLGGVEVRVLVTAGSGRPTATVLRTAPGPTAAEAGVAATSLVVDVGRTEISLHARGLANSPIAFVVDGIANPNFQDTSTVSPREPIALAGGEFVYDPSPDKTLPDDFAAIFTDGTRGTATYWVGGAIGWEGETHVRSLAPGLTLAAVGYVDRDRRPDLVLVSTEAPYLGVARHDPSLDDMLRSESQEVLPSDYVSIDRLLVFNLDGDEFSDVVLSVLFADSRKLVVYRSLAVQPGGGGGPVMGQAERIELPAFLADPDLVAADVDSDGDDDLVLFKPYDVSFIVPNGDDRDGHGSGWLYAPGAINTETWPRLGADRGALFVAFGDIDEDGLNDGVSLRDGVASLSARIQLARGDGTLQPVFVDLDAALPVMTIESGLVADLNGDGHLDVLATSAAAPLQAALLGGDGSGRFAAPLLLDVGFTPLALALSDLNRDGIYDIGMLGRRCEGGSHLLIKTSSSIAR